jgi:peptidoglycan hydrolase-like protein with peptidoglycan-binding domain
LVYVATLPDDQACEEVKDGTETLYLCDGVLYRSTYHDDTQVYEIVSPAEEEAAAQAQSMLGLGLTSPYTRGPAVRELQNLLVGYEYDVGSVDGIFGMSTEAAVLWLQYDYELEQTGKIDDPTARLLGLLPPEEGSEDSEASGVEAPADAEEGAEAPASDSETEPEAEAEKDAVVPKDSSASD